MFRKKKQISLHLAIIMILSTLLCCPAYAAEPNNLIVSTDDSASILANYQTQINYVEQITGCKIRSIDQFALDNIMSVVTMQLNGELPLSVDLEPLRFELSKAIANWECQKLSEELNQTRGSYITISDTPVTSSARNLYGNHIATVPAGSSTTLSRTFSISPNANVAGYTIQGFTYERSISYTINGPDGNQYVGNNAATHTVGFSAVNGYVYKFVGYYVNDIGGTTPVEYYHIDNNTATIVRYNAYAYTNGSSISVKSSSGLRTTVYSSWNQVQNDINSSNVTKFI